MTRRRPYSLIVGAAFVVATAGIVSSGLWAEDREAAQKPAAPQAAVKDPKAIQKSPTESLGGAERWLTHVNTDKPIYRAGEKVYVRGVLLRADNHHPMPDNQSQQVMIQVKGPKGEVLNTGYSQTQNSVAGFAWEVPQGAAGGQYTILVTHPWSGFAPAERKFEVRAYRAPRLKSQTVFVRDGYGPGDQVAASLHVDRAEGGPAAGAKVQVIARVDGTVVYSGNTQVNNSGNATTSFELPKEIARGEGTLAWVIEDGGIVETASKTIPILLQTVDLSMYPEGGELVAGLPSRIYLEAKTPSQKPADLAGIVVDEAGKTVAEFKTEHEGRGRFEITPQKGAKYTLKISAPAGIKTTYALPETKAEGTVVRSAANLFGADESIRLEVGAASSGKLTVTLSRREVELAKQEVKVEAGKLSKVELKPSSPIDGVLIATVWSEDGKPLAERLVFRKPAASLQVSIKPDQDSYVPGGKAKLTVKMTTADGKPVAGVVGVTVSDDSVHEMIEKREQAPQLLTAVLLENDVQELADAHVYFDAKHEKGPLALDLLLGTQGWRRFAMVDTAKFIETHGDQARRVLALKVAARHELREAAKAERLFANEAVPQRGAELKADLVKPQAAAAPDDKAAPVPKAAPVEELKVAEDVAGKKQAKELNARQDQVAGRDAAGQDRLEEALEKNREAADGRRLFRAADMKRVRMGNAAVIREYAHKARPDRKPNDRVDFAETLYWTAAVKTDPMTGEASIAFDMSDAVTAYRVLADAFDGNGSLGVGRAEISSIQPFYVEPKLPLEITSGDIIQLPLGVVNASSQPLSEVTLAPSAGGLTLGKLQAFGMRPGSRVRQLLRLEAGSALGQIDFTLKATGGGFEDTVTRKLLVKPLGFPIEIAHSGMLKADGKADHEIVVPEHIIAGSMTTHIAVYPTPLASMTEALERLLQEPYGCFEQTSSTTYPLVMAQQYFQSHTGVDPKIIARANDLLAKGYARLTSFECKQGGFEWFGEDPGHEALTAFGLMEFTDMSKVWNVDTAMLERTRKWLLGTRDGNGGFKRARRALHTWVTDADVSNGYILWALLESGEKPADLAKEIESLKTAMAKCTNSYALAQAANVLGLAGDTKGMVELLDRLVKQQKSDGGLGGATQSIVGSGGEALEIEATAFAAMAWLRHEDYIDFTDKAIRYLANSCKGGRYGSTQSTVLALRAIVSFDKANARPKAKGSLQLLVDDKPVGEPVAFDRETQGAITLPDIRKLLTPGKHTLSVKMADGSSMPYVVNVQLNSTKPASSDKCDIAIGVHLVDEAIKEGEVTEARLSILNKSEKVVPNPIAIVGIPGGLEVRHDQLKELVKANKIAAYEVLGREVVLYWRELAAESKVELPISLIAAIPGDYTAPASRGYLYYTDEHKHWVDPLQVSIAPRATEE